jgi:GR25 family glycosyltransferase involved in LPS biosynthesis
LSRFAGRLYNGKPLNLFQISCFLSHRAAWEQLLESDDDWLAVFEDDAHFGNDTASFLDDRWIPDGVSLIRLETSVHRTRVSIDPVAVHAGRGLYAMRGAHMGSAGYILSRQCARRLMELTKTISAPVDCFLFDPREVLMQDMNVHQLVPAPVIQEGVLAHVLRQEEKPILGTISTQVMAKKYLGPKDFVRKWMRLSRRSVLLLQYKMKLYRLWSDQVGPEVTIQFR